MSRKKSPLEKILKIDKDIDRIKKDTTYLRIRKGLKTINGFNHGRRFVTIPSLQDVGKELRLRKRSKELKTVKTAYKERLSEFEAEITLLRRKKAALEVQIFG
jgi:hypothetical protein